MRIMEDSVQGRMDFGRVVIFGVVLGDYCSASGGCDLGSIDRVQVGTIRNYYTGCDNYADYTHLSTEMYIGASYSITVYSGWEEPLVGQCGVWVDWNCDEDFSDANETIVISNEGWRVTGVIRPPEWAALGSTRMRVRNTYTGGLSPCGSTADGEVEDYTITVTDEPYGGGTGEPNDPYLIYTSIQMNNIGLRPEDWDKHFRLMADIDMRWCTGEEFNIIGTDPNNGGTAFTGSFDGNGHKILNFTYSRSDGCIGIFGCVMGEDTEIRNLGLIDPNVNSDEMWYWFPSVGSLVGAMWGGKITDCYVMGGSARGGGDTGGLVGYAYDGRITNCHSRVSVSGISNDSQAGGLVGRAHEGIILNCYSAGNVYGDSGGVGGLVGDNTEGTIDNCYSASGVSGGVCTGGLVGFNFGGTISNCYANGPVDGDGHAGGLVGKNLGSVVNCYSTGYVAITDGEEGGLVGVGDANMVTNCFWDRQTSLRYSSSGGTGLPTWLMQMESTFTDAGWDFNTPIWKIDDGLDYPRLWWQGKEYAGGSGNANKPYLISTAEQMNAIGGNPGDWDRHFKLMADIDLSAYTGTSFNIIGTSYLPFGGVFDGNGHTISNFAYDATEKGLIGIFGSVDGPNAEIRNLGLIDPNVSAGWWHVGAIAGSLWQGAVRNCFVRGGRVWGGKGCIGGLIGSVNDSRVSDCYSKADVIGDRYVGGLAGIVIMSGVITGCYAEGTVSGREYIGGLAGGNNNGTISNCCAMADVYGTDGNVGGLVGRNWYGTISKCYSTGSVSGNSYTGGLIGARQSGDVLDCFWDVNTSGEPNSAGGTGKTTAEMQTESTFTDAGWDFVDESDNGIKDIWRLCNEGTEYPQLNWQYPLGDFVCPDGVDGIDVGVLCEEWLLEELSSDVWPEGGDGFVDFLDWALIADGWGDAYDIFDLAEFADNWLKRGVSVTDIAPDGGDGITNGVDFSVLAEKWLRGM